MAKPNGTRRNRPSQHIGKRIQNARQFSDKLQSAEDRARSENAQLSDSEALSQLVNAARLNCHSKLLDAVRQELASEVHDVRYLQRVLCDNVEYYYSLLLEKPLVDEYAIKLKEIYNSAVRIRNIINANTVIRSQLDGIAQRDLRWSLHASSGYLVPPKRRSRDELVALGSPATKTLHALERLAVWARRAGRRPKSRGRTADHALNHFVFSLAQFRRYYLERPIAPRSMKRGSVHDFVRVIMRHVDPHVTLEQITTALRQAPNG